MSRNGKKITFNYECFELIQHIIYKKQISDILIKCTVNLLGKVNIDLFKKTAQLIIEKYPILSCKLNEGFFTSKWEFQDYPIEKFVYIVQSSEETSEKDLNEYLYKIFDIKKGPLARFVVFHYPDHDLILFMVNHLACDGQGLKELIYSFCYLYSCPDKTIPNPELGSRSLNQYFNELSVKEKFGLLMAKLKNYKDVPFKYEGDPNRPFMIKRMINQNEFQKMKTYSKAKNVTLNDIFLTAIIRAAESILNKTIVLPCAIDLRKFIKNNKTNNLTNLVFTMQCDIGEEIGSTFEETLNKVSNFMSKEKQLPKYLKLLYLLQLLKSFLPYCLLEKFILMNFDPLSTNYSNIGVVDKSKIYFKDIQPSHVHIFGAAICAPFNEISVSSYDNIITFTMSLYGSENDEKLATKYLDKVLQEIASTY